MDKHAQDLPSGVCSYPHYSLFLEDPGDRDPLRVFRDRFQGGFDGTVGLVQVVVDDAEVEVLAEGRLHLGALIARPLQLFVLKTR